MNVEKSLKYVFHVLSRCPKGAASSARIHIPDTLFYEHGTLQFWYRYDPDTHEIVRKDRRECSTDMIYEALGLEGRGVDASLRASAVSTMLAGGYNVNFPDVPVAVLLAARFVIPGFAPGDPRKDPENHRLRKETRKRQRAGRSSIRRHDVPLELVADDDDSSVDSDDSRGGASQPKQVIAETFLDRSGIDAYLNGNELKHHALLQRYPLGRALHATSVEAVYSPQVIHVSQRQNKRFLSDTSVSLYDRCVTSESFPQLVESVQISPKAKALIEDACRTIADHILAVEHRCVARMVCYFSFETCVDMLDEPGGIKPLLLWVSELHLSKEVPKEQVRRTLATFVERKLMQLQPETVPGILIGPGQRRKRGEHLLEKEKYLPYAARVGSPSVDQGRGGTERILASIKDRNYRKMCEEMEQFRTPESRKKFHKITADNNNNTMNSDQSRGSISYVSTSKTHDADVHEVDENGNIILSRKAEQQLKWTNSPFAHLINKLEREREEAERQRHNGANNDTSAEQGIKLILRAGSTSSGKRSELLPMSPNNNNNNSRANATPSPSTSSPQNQAMTKSQLELHFLAKGSRNVGKDLSKLSIHQLAIKAGKKGMLKGHGNNSNNNNNDESYVHNASFASSNDRHHPAFGATTVFQDEVPLSSPKRTGSIFSNEGTGNSSARPRSAGSSPNLISPRTLGPGASGPLSPGSPLRNVSSPRDGAGDAVEKTKGQLIREQREQERIAEKERQKADTELKIVLEVAKKVARGGSSAASPNASPLHPVTRGTRSDSVLSSNSEESAENHATASLLSDEANLNNTTSSFGSAGGAATIKTRRQRYLANQPPPIDAELFSTLSGPILMNKSKELCSSAHSPKWMNCLSPDVNLYLHQQLSALDAAHEWCSHMAYCFDNAARRAQEDQRAELIMNGQTVNPFKEMPDVRFKVEVTPFPPPPSRRQCPLTLQEIIIAPPKIYLFTAWKMILFGDSYGSLNTSGTPRGSARDGNSARNINGGDSFSSINKKSSDSVLGIQRHGSFAKKKTNNVNNNNNNNSNNANDVDQKPTTPPMMSVNRSSISLAPMVLTAVPSSSGLSGIGANILSTGDDRDYRTINRVRRVRNAAKFIGVSGETGSTSNNNSFCSSLQQSQTQDENNNNNNNRSSSLTSPSNNNNNNHNNYDNINNEFSPHRFESSFNLGGSGGGGGVGAGGETSIFGEDGGGSNFPASKANTEYSPNSFSVSPTFVSEATRRRLSQIKKQSLRFKPGYLITQQPLSDDSYVVPYAIESHTIISNLGSAAGREVMSVSSSIDSWTIIGVDEQQLQNNHHDNNNNNTTITTTKGGKHNKHSSTSGYNNNQHRLLDTPVMALSAIQMLSTTYILQKFPVFNPRGNNFVVPYPFNGFAQVTCCSARDAKAKAEAFRQLARIAMTSRRFILFETIGIALRKAATFSKKMHLSAITAEAQLSGADMSTDEGKRGSAFMAAAVRLFREDTKAKQRNEEIAREEESKRKEIATVHNDPGRVIRRFFSEVPCALSAPATWGPDLHQLQLRFTGGSETNDKADRLELAKARDVFIHALPTEVAPIARQLQNACEKFTIELKMELMRMLRVACLPSYLAEVPPDISEDLRLLDTTSKMRRPTNRSRMTAEQQQMMFNDAMRQMQIDHDSVANRKQNPALIPIDAANEDWPPKMVLRPDNIPEGLC